MGDVEAWKRVDQRAVMEQGMRSMRESKRASVEFRGKDRRMTRQDRHLAGHHGPFPEQLWTKWIEQVAAGEGGHVGERDSLQVIAT